ncbi:MAG TPA: winged helix-turn-helix domain-containing protein [Acidobacteriota bacterium]|nr:winged helix-turn-helix domain-containing protein [Acidobacteriota bacterium]
MARLANELYEFSGFTLVPAERLLKRGEKVVALPAKAFDLLSVMVENHGRLLQKDELMQKVWPDSFVEEANLSYNVSLLRRALGQSGEAQDPIETVPKWGYRFVAPVTKRSGAAADATVADHTTALPDYAPAPVVAARRQLFNMKWLGLALGGLFAAGAVFLLTTLRLKKDEGRPELPYKIVPITSYPGVESQPSFSPDGSQLAFTWNNAGNSDIYVKVLGVDKPLRLTQDPATDNNPVWLSDGRRIAFIRSTGDSSTVFLVSPLGGQERRVAELSRFRPYQNSMDASPDAKLLAVSDKTRPDEPFAIFLLSIETGEKRRLTQPPPGVIGDDNPRFSPDGQNIAFGRQVTSRKYDLYVIAPTGARQRRVSDQTAIVHGITWANTTELVFSSNIREQDGLWRLDIRPGGLVRPLGVGGTTAFRPVIAPRQRRLAYTARELDTNIWQMESSGIAGRWNEPKRLIFSSQWDEYPSIWNAPGAKTRIAFSSSRSGDSEIWTCDSNGSNLLQLTNFNGPRCYYPSWSPDGRTLAFDVTLEGQRDIYLIEGDGGPPRRLTEEASDDSRPAWSRDGKSIYFSSNKAGSLDIWKIPARGGRAIQVTRSGGWRAVESFDSKYVYFMKRPGQAGIWRLPVSGGSEELVLDYEGAGSSACWDVARNGIYFAIRAWQLGSEKSVLPTIHFFDFQSRQVTMLARCEKPILNISGLSVSPDERTILFTQVDRFEGDIVLVENFR